MGRASLVVGPMDVVRLAEPPLTSKIPPVARRRTEMPKSEQKLGLALQDGVAFFVLPHLNHTPPPCDCFLCRKDLHARVITA